MSGFLMRRSARGATIEAAPLLGAAIVALAVSVLLAAPAGAASFDARNAKKVDGIRAVEFTKKSAKRKHRLIAANKKGRLPNNVIRKAPVAKLAEDLGCQGCVSAPELDTSNRPAGGKVLGFRARGLAWRTAATGDITAVNAGSGLTGGGGSGDVTLSVDPGAFWSTAGNSGTTPSSFLGTTDSKPLTLKVNGGRALMLEPTASTPNVLGGSPLNSITAGAVGGTIGGGGRVNEDENRVTDSFGTVGGGVANLAGDAAGSTADREFATVAGGGGNVASGSNATVGGGGDNNATTAAATIGGGSGNNATGADGTVAGGADNRAGAGGAAVGGGLGNDASGPNATVPGGFHNTAAGAESLAAGNQAEANNQGAFVWADSTPADFPSTADNQFAVRASGGFRFRTKADLSTGCNLPANSGVFQCTSDARTKRDFRPVNAVELLARLRRLPISTWRFKGEDPSVRHLGPTAQDFHHAFGLGDSRTSIGLPDANGVALTAIKELASRLGNQRRRVLALRARVRSLERSVTGLSKVVRKRQEGG